MRAIFLLGWLAIGLAFCNIEIAGAAPEDGASIYAVISDVYVDHAEYKDIDTKEDGELRHVNLPDRCCVGLASHEEGLLCLPLDTDASLWTVGSFFLSSITLEPSLHPPSA